MHPDKVRAFGYEELEGATNPQDREFALGVLAAADGQFHEERCREAGTIWESEWCAGGREGTRRLNRGMSKRMQHGDIMEEV